MAQRLEEIKGKSLESFPPNSSHTHTHTLYSVHLLFKFSPMILRIVQPIQFFIKKGTKIIHDLREKTKTHTKSNDGKFERNCM